MLFDALDLYDKQDAKADDNIRAIQQALPEAVDTCIEAACHEMDVTLQEQLLKAAAYGKCFLAEHELRPRAARVVSALATLRALNALREYTVGVPLTYAQLQKLTPARLVQRLARRQQHYLALQLCAVLKLGREEIEGVQVHWASERVLRGDNLNDQQLLSVIQARLSAGPAPVSTADVASTAFNLRTKPGLEPPRPVRALRRIDEFYAEPIVERFVRRHRQVHREPLHNPPPARGAQRGGSRPRPSL